MFQKIKNIDPVWLIPITIIFFVFVGVTAWFATEGNVIFIFIGNSMITIFTFLIFIVYPSNLIFWVLSIRCVTERELKKAGINWEEVKMVFIENRWAEEVYFSYDGANIVISGRIYLTVDPESQKEKLYSLFGPQFDALFPILKRNWKKLPAGQRWAVSYGVIVAVWGLLILMVTYKPEWLSHGWLNIYLILQKTGIHL